jgi:hypothetical protein
MLVADVAPYGRRGPAGSGFHDDPRRLVPRLELHLIEIRLGDVVFAAPRRQGKLIEIVAA